jgi:3-isopropylmalate dehydrogenase
MAAPAASAAVRDIVILPGDGIGAAVCQETVRVLNAAGFKANYHHGDIGWEFWCKEGNALPQRTIDLIDKYKVALFGAITSKPKPDAEKELAPELRGKGFVYYSPIVTLRQHYNLDICIRPCRSIAGNPLNFVRRSADGSIEEPPIDVVVFRQNTECMYCGVEWTNPPDQVYQALQTHPKFAAFTAVPRADLAVSCRIFTRQACRRICEAAFEYAVKHGYKHVTVCEKPNVVRETSGMMEAEARLVAKQRFPGIPVYSTNIDAQMMWMTKSPEDYGVIIASNMFGDIASDGFAGLVGGLGFACSANLGSGGVAVFEPTHGSAPKYQELKPSIVNPIACILSACMMLDHIGEPEIAQRIRAAIAKVVKEGKSRTYDMMRLRGGPQVISQGAASTDQIADAIIAAL